MTKFSVVLCFLTFWIFSGLWSGTNGGGGGMRHKHNRQGRRFLLGHSGSGNVTGPSGSWPSVYNLATKATIVTNATCGESGREEFCREHHSPRGRAAQCGVCDAHSPDPNKRHPIEYAIDGNNNHWWQSPSLDEGLQYESVAVTIDLGQVYEVAYVIIRAGASPRPAAWALEHSTDGDLFLPWQYFARSSSECEDLFGIPVTPGKPKPKAFPEPTCTTFHSKMQPVENGEIHHSVLSSNEEWSVARWVRLRFLSLHGAAQGRLERKFYTLKDLTIGGRCACSGHANQCKLNPTKGIPECECVHHTCGSNCDRCCPMFNQLAYMPGVKGEPNICQSCECHGHSLECIYDQQIDEQNKSVDVHGRYKGGGVCINCEKHTTGVNCELCEFGYFRPPGVSPDDEEPCLVCDCNVNGSTGQCIYNQVNDVVACECREGYSGLKCDKCNLGYTGFPNCAMCPCNSAGSIFMEECNGECYCKYNVEGKYCDKCKMGYFALEESNPEGCLPCYCSGVSDICYSASIENHIFQTLQNWTVTDISTSRFVAPTFDSTTEQLTITDDEFYNTEAYYWNAPDLYLGNKLKAYGSVLLFRVGWLVMRGDTSGKPTTGPNIIIIGHNGMKIAYDDISYEQKDMIEISIPLIEKSWYHVPKSVKDIVTRLKRTEYKGDLVSREQFMNVITNIKHVLLRAKYHTDQVEGILEGAVILVGNNDFERFSSKVEKCHCPPGYTGLSCELCAFGHVKRLTNTSQHLEKFECIKCNCNGHSESCDLDTNKCSPCEHNTMGEKCERCISGYYGNPLIGNRNDCKRCACPMLEDGNNFSPSCAMDGDKYFCTQCPEGYTGDHCEICDYGFFGNPMIIGSKCEPCSCNGGPCNNITGQCLSCPGNTEGFKCDSCKTNHYGIPSERDCKPCDCDIFGSANMTCHPITGECKCNMRFGGRTCNLCEEGYGNVTAGCILCDCDTIGSKSNICDPITGSCNCHPGTDGIRCDTCLDLHYGFSNEGCKWCNCNEYGSEIKKCDIKTGECRCLPHVTGLSCDQCKFGYWGLKSRNGCTPCQCDSIGTIEGSCDIETGACLCQPGVGGQSCDTCLPGYYGFSKTGCLRCEICSAGHICDPDTGRCICPPLSQGISCNECRVGSWGLDPLKGCKFCNCSIIGAVRTPCDSTDGHCLCSLGFAGTRCDKCAPNYYGFPQCRPCACNYAGTLPESCNENKSCVCDEFTGQCPCKANVMGTKCKDCKDGTFSLTQDNPSGCTQCFCFGRSSHCTQAGLTRGHIRINIPRVLSITYSNDNSDYGIKYISINSQNSHNIIKSNMFLNITNGVTLIPETEGNVTIETDSDLAHPLYWELPKKFLGDRITSYGGFLKFNAQSYGMDERIPFNILKQFPLVQIHAQGVLILEYYEKLPMLDDMYHVRFHESLWTYKTSKSSRHMTVDRATLMVALQKVEAIYIRGTHYAQPINAILSEISMDTAISIKGQPALLATSVELCKCPYQYNSTSCQDASIGYYIPPHSISNASGTIIIQLIGRAELCDCHGRSETCDRHTGHCTECRDNTGGMHCDQCAEGYYGNPFHPDGCQPCPCPHVARNYASSCQIDIDRVLCQCKEGYTGGDCSQCDRGWWLGNDGKCRHCECNAGGTIQPRYGGILECHPTTGQCPCHPYVTGMRCDFCITPRYFLESSMCVPCDNCSQTLLDTVELMTHELMGDMERFRDISVPKPWTALYEISNRTHNLDRQVDNTIYAINRFKGMPEGYFNNFGRNSDMLFETADSLEYGYNNTGKDMMNLKNNSQDLFNKLMDAHKRIENLIAELEDFSRHDKVLNVGKVLKEAKHTLKKIKDFDFEDFLIDAESSFVKSNLKSTSINEYIYKLKDHENKIENLNNSFKNWHEKIDEINNFIEDTFIIADKVRALVNKNTLLLQHIVQKKDQIERIDDSIGDIGAPKDFNKAFQECEDSILNLRYAIPSLKNLTEETENREGILNHINPDYEERYYIPSKNYVEELEKVADSYKNLFVETNNGASNAITASTNFNNIVQTIEAAKKSANETLELIKLADRTEAGRDFYPYDGTNGSLYYISEFLKRESDELLNRVKKLSLEDVKASLERSKQRMEETRVLIRSLAWKDKDLYISTNNLNVSDIEKNLAIAYNKSDRVFKTMQGLNKEADTTQKHILYKLKIKLQELESNGDFKIGKAEEIISSTKGYIKKAADLASTLKIAARQREFEMKRANVTISESLQKLKDQILRAKHAADGIRISMKSSENIGCLRSYKIHNLTPSINTHITISLSLTPDNSKDSVLFYLPSASTTDFVKVELINRKIKFSWNLGGDTAYVLNPEALQTYSEASYDFNWYKIEATRIWNVGKVVVQKYQTDMVSMSARMATNNSNPSWGILDVKYGDLAWIGGVGHVAQKNSGISGCMHKIYFNGKQIGLWNFYSQPNKNGCETCINGVEDEKAVDQNMFYWNGAGYSVLKRSNVRPFNKNQFSILLTFRTLDENALLFLAIDEANNRSVSLQLREGRVVFKIDYAGESRLEINTTEKFNTGKFVQVQAARVFIKRKIEKGSLKVDGNEQLGLPNPPVIHSTSLPDLTDSEYLIGGIPPIYRSSSIIQTLPPPFLGCLGEVAIDQEGYNPMDTKVYYGVESSCSDKPLTSVGFYGDGFLELGSHTLHKKAHLGFMFRTLQSNAFLMLSAPPHYSLFNNGDGSYDSTYTTESEFVLLGGPIGNEEYFSISLVEGKIHVLMNAGKGDLKLVSNTTELNDGLFHAVSIVKSSRKIELHIDDNLKASGTLPPGAVVIHSSTVEGNVSRGLFLGGVPNNLNETDMTNQYIASTIPLRGAIKDIVLDDKVIPLDGVVDMNHAYVGRLGPPMGEELEIGANLLNTQESDSELSRSSRGCRKVYSYSLEPSAVKFGDLKNSYTQVQLLGSNIWRKNFALELDFRTFYPNGLLFVAPSAKRKQRHLVSLFLRDGKITLLFKGKKVEEKLIPINVNNGKWHHVLIKSEDRRITVTYSGSSVSLNIPRKMVLSNTLYIGGIPEKSITIPKRVAKIEGFLGCIRRLTVNGKLEDLVKKPSLHNNVGQCFPAVEMGSYFQGDAYAMYKKEFIISPQFELRLEFRTVEMNGVLLSASHSNVNTPAVSLELHNAKVVMAVLTSAGRRFKVTTSLPTKFGLCDNNWHNVSALFSANELMIRVDQEPEVTDVGMVPFHGQILQPSINEPSVFTPLYIGGLSDIAPTGTLTNKDNFKGCIRNVAIEGHQTDWTDMDYLHHVLLSSCPI